MSIRHLTLLALASLLLGGEAAAPFIDAKAVRERFASITPQDMAMLREKRILLVSRSFGLNTRDGLQALAKQDATYDLLSAYKRFDVFKAGGDLAVVPPDAFASNRFVHVLGTFWPFTKRVEETEALLRAQPHNFASVVDAVVVFYHTANAAAFAPYAARMDALCSEFPRIRFIHVTAGFMGPKFAKENTAAHAFSEQVRERYRGKRPVFDMGAILSDDFRAGQVFCPEYSKDPAQVHPDAEAGELALGKGFLLVLRDAFRMPDATAAAIPQPAAAAPVAAESLPTTHPEYRAVRAILDANGLSAKKVEGVAVVRDGHVVELYLQEGGIRTLPEEIGVLTALEKLHLYGDRNLGHPLLTSISPAIGRCTALRDLLLTSNDLPTLPGEIAKLQALTSLSLADNRLRDLPPEVVAWATRFDPKGLAGQRAP
jgi:hypothetical protein